MSIGGVSQCEKLSKCKVANEHRRVLCVDLLIINFKIIWQKDLELLLVKAMTVAFQLQFIGFKNSKKKHSRQNG